jgi:hypothetical protein
MRSRAALVTAVGLVTSSLSLSAHASPREDLAFAVEGYNHDKHSGWIIERLVTLNVADRCWPKLVDKAQRGLGLLASDARSIEHYARAATGDDWAALESQSANTREANRAMVDKLVDDFQPRFHVTLTLEGDDCSATGNDLWLKYLGSALGSLAKYPPRSGTANLVIDVKAKVKDLTIAVDKAGTTFTITAPRDVERPGWSDTIENALLRVSTKR